MAWLLDIRSDNARYQPRIAPIPGCQTTNDLHVSIKSLLNDAQEYKAAHGFLPLGIHAEGNEIPQRFWPQEGHFIDDFEDIPPLLGLASFYLVHESWRDIIEEFEPCIHQFKYVPLFRKDHTELKKRYFAVNIRRALRDISDKQRSTAPYKVYGGGVGKFLNTSDSYNSKVYFNRNLISDNHLWCPIDILIYHIAMSNDLFDRVSQLDTMNSVKTLLIEEV